LLKSAINYRFNKNREAIVDYFSIFLCRKIFKVYIIIYIMKMGILHYIIACIFFFSILGATLFFCIDIVSAEDANNTMIVQANIIGFRNNVSYEGIAIQVPDFIDLGNVTNEEPVSKELKININNTGTVGIIVTPELSDPNEGIFSYLFFRTHMTSGGVQVPYNQIGNYSLEIDKPSTGSSVRKGYCYMRLNLTDFSAPITQDLIGHQAEITFWAMPAN
jgi:hypothetical protein